MTRTLEGRVWQKAIDRTALDAARASFPVISTRLLAGRTLVNVVADAPPAPGFAAVEPTLEDVYFAAIAGRLQASVPAREAGMSALLAIAWFEFRTRVKRISTWVYFLVFFALAMLWIAAAGGAVPNAIVAFGSGKVWVNSPYAIAQTVAFLGMAALTIVAAVMGRAVQQDFEYRVEPFFFTAPISKREYLGGRFLGAVAVLVVILSSIPLGGIARTAAAGHRYRSRRADAPRRVRGPLRHDARCRTSSCSAALFFCIAALTRRMLPVYIAQRRAADRLSRRAGAVARIDNKTLAGDARSVRRRRRTRR